MAVTEADVRRALASVRYPGFTRDIVSFGAVEEIVVEGGAVRLRIAIRPANPAVSRLKAERLPILTWTVRSPAEEAAARRVADNITFEGYRPGAT